MIRIWCCRVRSNSPISPIENRTVAQLLLVAMTNPSSSPSSLLLGLVSAIVDVICTILHHAANSRYREKTQTVFIVVMNSDLRYNPTPNKKNKP